MFVVTVFAVILPGAFGHPAAERVKATTHRSAPEAILVATPRRGKPLVLRNRPAGRALAVLRRRTSLGSPVKLGIAIARGNWIAVISERLPNGVLGWVPRRDVTVLPIRWSIDVSLSRHVLEVRRDGAVVRRVRVGIGAASTPTPRGRFVITDHLDARRYGGVYGCCILVLSGHETHPPSSYDPRVDWRVAIHGGAGLGSATSAGCLHAPDSDLRMLMRLTPLGTPVVIAS